MQSPHHSNSRLALVTRRPGFTSALISFLVTSLILAGLVATSEPAHAQADPHAVVLDAYRFHPTAGNVQLLREAVADKLAAVGAPNGPSDIDADIALAASDESVRKAITPWFAAVLFEALLAPERTPAQDAFNSHFQGYYADTQVRIAQTTLNAWEEYQNPQYGPPSEYGPCCTLSLLYETGPSFAGFTPPNNAIGIGGAGYQALNEFLGPMADSGIPSIQGYFDDLGFDPGDGSQTVAALAGLGFTAGSMAVIYGAFAAYMAGVAAAQIAATTGTAVTTVTSVVAGQIVEKTIETAIAGATAITVGGTATTFAMAALVVVPLLIAGGMKIADFVQAAQFEEGLRATIEDSDRTTDFRGLVGLKTDYDAGLYYTPCRDGYDGVANSCYEPCPPGYTTNALNCTRDAHTIPKDAYHRGGGEAPTGCSDGRQLEGPRCYDPCPAGTTSDGVIRCYTDCPTGWTGTLTDCDQPDQFWDPYSLAEYDECAANTGSCTQKGGLYYVDCASPYEYESLQECQIPCPAGFDDTGEYCRRPFTERADGTAPDVCADPSRTSLEAGLCYQACQAGYGGIGVECVEQLVCPDGYSDTGRTCYRDPHTIGRASYDRGVGSPSQPEPEVIETNKATLFSFLLKLLVADPVDVGTLSNPRSAEVPPPSLPTPNVAPEVMLSPAATTEGAAATVDAVLYDPNPTDTHEVVVDWGDGSPEEAFTPADLPALQHTYADDGTYDVTVTAIDDRELSASATTAVEVANATPVVDVVGDSTEEGGTVNVAASFTDAGTNDTHTASVDWGDGTDPEPVTIGDLGSLSHAFVQDGDFTVTVTVTDDDGAAGVATATNVVANVLPSVVIDTLDGDIDEGGTATATVSFTDPGVLDSHTATVDWGDGSGPQSVDADDLASLSHTYAEDGTFGLAVSVDDDDGTATTGLPVTVTNVAPTVSVTGAEELQQEAVGTFEASFSDPGLNDTHTASVDWGDGSGPQSVALADLPALTHSWALDGAYEVTVTVTDDDGGLGTASMAVTVLSPRAVLADLADSLRGHENAKVRKAVEDLDDAIGHTAWIDDATLGDRGKKVFDDLAKAAKDLRKEGLVEEAAVVAEQALIVSSRAVETAQGNVDDADCAQLDCDRAQDELDKAWEDLARAEQALAAGDEDDAVKRARKAWDRAEKAMDRLGDLDDDD